MTDLGRRMRRSYQAVLLLLAASATILFWVNGVVDARQQRLAALSVLATEQRVLVKRVSLMVVMLAQPRPLAGSQRLRRDIADDLRAISANHRELKAAAGLGPAGDRAARPAGDAAALAESDAARVFAAAPHRLDDRLALFVANARRVLAAPLGQVDPALVDPLSAAARTSLPAALDAALAVYRREHALFEERRDHVERAVLGAWFLLLVGLSFGIFRPMIRAVEEKTAALEAARARMEHTALHDSLTALPNRRYLSEHLATTLARARRNGQVTAVLHLDLDRFKQVNDSLGHAAGDAVLLEAARRMQRTVRQSDFLARIGGDEFVIVASNVRSIEGLSRLADRLIDQLTTPIDYEGTPCHIGTSVGIALAAHDSQLSPERLIMNADAALYAAKHDGRGCHRFFGDDAAVPLPGSLRPARRGGLRALAG